MILELIAEARACGARLTPCCETIELDTRTVQRWLKQGPDGGEDRRQGPETEPTNKLSEAERKEVIEVATRPEFRDLSPNQLVPILADLGIYVASESTIYRILKAQRLDAHRGRTKPPKRKRPEEHVATGPNRVWCWDITFLRSPVRGSFFYLYLFLDVWSRKIVGWRVYDREDNELAAQAFEAICRAEGIDPETLVLHSDNGAAMKGATMVATLEKLGVQQSLSRPRVSDDNPFAESIFRTLKYRPNFPDKPFESVATACQWVEGFVTWYNEEHRHSGISYVTPAQRHAGLHIELLQHRERVYNDAKKRNPERWTGCTRNWDPIPTVRLNPRGKNTEKPQVDQAA